MCQASVNLMPGYIKLISNKVPRFDICRSIMSLSGASNVARSPIQSKKQDNKNSCGGELGGDGEGEAGHLKKGW